MAMPNRIGKRANAIVNTTDKSSVADVRARIIWKMIIAPLPRYRRAEKTPAQLKTVWKMEGLLQTRNTKPKTKTASIGERMKIKN